MRRSTFGERCHVNGISLRVHVFSIAMQVRNQTDIRFDSVLACSIPRRQTRPPGCSDQLTSVLMLCAKPGCTKCDRFGIEKVSRCAQCPTHPCDECSCAVCCWRVAPRPRGQRKAAKQPEPLKMRCNSCVNREADQQANRLAKKQAKAAELEAHATKFHATVADPATAALSTGSSIPPPPTVSVAHAHMPTIPFPQQQQQQPQSPGSAIAPLL